MNVNYIKSSLRALVHNQLSSASETARLSLLLIERQQAEIELLKEQLSEVNSKEAEEM